MHAEEREAGGCPLVLSSSGRRCHSPASGPARGGRATGATDKSLASICLTDTLDCAKNLLSPHL